MFDPNQKPDTARAENSIFGSPEADNLLPKDCLFYTSGLILNLLEAPAEEGDTVGYRGLEFKVTRTDYCLFQYFT